MEFKRLNKNSVVRFYSTKEFLNDESTLYIIEEKNTILQMIEHEATDTLIVEYLPREAQEQSAVSFDRDIEFDNALDTIINNDPFGAKYSGKPIRCIFENGDNEWLDKALNLMHNEFIRKKLEYIVARGGYGKIKR